MQKMTLTGGRGGINFAVRDVMKSHRFGKAMTHAVCMASNPDVTELSTTTSSTLSRRLQEITKALTMRRLGRKEKA